MEANAVTVFDRLRASVRDLEVFVSNNIRRTKPLEWEEFNILLGEVLEEYYAEELGWFDCLDLGTGSLLNTAEGLACGPFLQRLSGKLDALARYAVLIDPTSVQLAETVLSVSDELINRTRTDRDVLPSVDNIVIPKVPGWVWALVGLFVLDRLSRFAR